MILVTKWFGTFIVDHGKVLESRLAPKDLDAIVSRMKKMRNREILPDELDLGRKVSAVAERRLGSLGKIVAFDSGFIRAEDYGFDIDLLKQATMIIARESLTEEDPGAFITEQVRAFDDLLATCNLMSERLREWYGLYFPELEKLVDEKRYAELISQDPERKAMMSSLGKEIEESTGAPFSDDDLGSIKVFASTTLEIFKSREGLESAIQHKMKEEATNLSAVAGPIIGARLISLAGGMKRLAGMPTSTIQLLGAEKAMFRHLKDKSRPPKHGVIFQHPHIHKAPYWQRGKIARALAGKISIAARADFYSDNDISDELVKLLERRIEEIKKRNPNPPIKPPRGGKKGHKKRRDKR
ncbi:MAG: ribosomal biogenesis protein [Thermoplasmata archaeon]|nr:ribosomal biogenesis protein [Thermoplasmata archaeon]